MRVLITGGSGFIGSNLARLLISKGHEVHICDVLASKLKRSIFHECDIAIPEEFASYIKVISVVPGPKTSSVSGCDIVFHEAALTSVPESFKTPEKFMKVNVEGTRNVLEACRKHDVKKVILASSAAVYGDGPALPKTEESVLEPKSPYAESKLQNEKDAKKYFEEYGLKTVCLRYFNVYGPGQDPKSQYSGVISKFMDCAIEHKKPMIFGNGKQTRDFVFVQDVVNANILAMEKKGVGGEVFNIATGIETSVLGLWGEIQGISGFQDEPEFAPSREGDILRSVASIEKARKRLGYEPKYSIREGLEKTMEWVKHGY